MSRLNNINCRSYQYSRNSQVNPSCRDPIEVHGRIDFINNNHRYENTHPQTYREDMDDIHRWVIAEQKKYDY